MEKSSPSLINSLPFYYTSLSPFEETQTKQSSQANEVFECTPTQQKALAQENELFEYTPTQQKELSEDAVAMQTTVSLPSSNNNENILACDETLPHCFFPSTTPQQKTSFLEFYKDGCPSYKIEQKVRKRHRTPEERDTIEKDYMEREQKKQKCLEQLKENIRYARTVRFEKNAPSPWKITPIKDTNKLEQFAELNQVGCGPECATPHSQKIALEYWNNAHRPLTDKEFTMRTRMEEETRKNILIEELEALGISDSNNIMEIDKYHSLTEEELEEILEESLREISPSQE